MTVLRNKTRVCLLLIVLVVTLTLAQTADAQLAAATNAVFTATLRGHVSLSTTLAPVSIALDVDNPESNYAAIPLEIDWNLSPREVQRFEVVGYFVDPGAALVGSAPNTSIPADGMLGRWNSPTFSRFEQGHTGAPGASVQLFSEAVLPGSSRGSRSGLLELKIDPQRAQTLKNDEYRGVIYIEVRHY